MLNQQPINPDEIQRIWTAQRLGTVHSIARTPRGMINQSLIVNDAFVLRLDTLHNGGVSRYVGEKLAYDTLRTVNVPVPQVIALDTSRKVTDRDYLIMTRLPGDPVVDGWRTLNAQQREQIAIRTGEILALMHLCPMKGFGDLADARFNSWYAEVLHFFTGYAEDGLRNGALNSGLVARIAALLRKMRPTLDKVRQGVIVHADCHFENVLQVDGQVTGVIDFEWGKIGDPLWDFRVDDKWEEMCPGSRGYVYEGYATHRRLPNDHVLRSRFYKLLMHLNDTAMGKEHGDAVIFEDGMEALMLQLTWLEAHFRA